MVIYILCPANRVTGGVELAHQLCCAINRLTEIKAYMWYTDIDNTTRETLVVNMPLPKDYLMYNTQCIEGLDDFFKMDDTENVVVFPEGLTGYCRLLDNARKVLWWMSVDNYIKSTNESNLDELASEIMLHLYQSFYSKEYVERKIQGAKGMFLSDYINEQHGQFLYPAEYRQDIALFNPQKGFQNIEPLIEKADWIKWIPLIGMDREKMILMMQSGKIYVDFGNHPGKDRIPREAAANGCCVITNREGSAAFYDYVPIPDKYKFENTADSLDDINSLMHDICDNFKAHQIEFESYRNMIKSEKKKFDDAVIEFVDFLKKA